MCVYVCVYQYTELVHVPHKSTTCISTYVVIEIYIAPFDNLLVEALFVTTGFLNNCLAMRLRECSY